MNYNTIAIRDKTTAPSCEFDDGKVELLKNTICKGATNEEFELFLHACKRTGLDPFMRQIYSVKRWDSNLKRDSMTIQTGIDGYRLIAERTGRYCPGKETTYQYDSEGNLVSATAYIKKQTLDGTWHEVPATAFFSEFCQRTKEGKPMAMWMKIPHIMLAKCAESLALRKSFPAELSGIYTKEEMTQVEHSLECKADLHETREYISQEDARSLEMALQNDEEYKNKILNHYKISCLEELERKNFNAVYSRTMQYMMKKNQEVKDVQLNVEASIFEVKE